MDKSTGISKARAIIEGGRLVEISDYQVERISIINMAGQVVGSISQKHIYSLENLNEGIYTAVVEMDNKLVVKKFLLR